MFHLFIIIIIIRDMASGYCYCNDVVLAILRLQRKFSRILYVDIDVHHGDGVEEAFWHSPKVMTVSFHHFSPGFFPGTGAVADIGRGRGKFHTINVPLHEGVQDHQYYSVFSGVMTEVRERYQPQCLLLQCGADLLTGDPLGEFNLTPRGAGRCVEFLLQWRLPTVMMGGGGYNFPNTARFWALCTGLALGLSLHTDIPDHKFFPEYSPTFQLDVTPGNRADKNTAAYTSTLVHQVKNYLSNISV
jgi:histone deacetylase 8